MDQGLFLFLAALKIPFLIVQWLFKFIASRLKKRSIKKMKVREARLRNAISFDVDEIFADIKDYVEPDCGNVDPCNEIEFGTGLAVREPVFRALDRELSAKVTKHILILADSGMGKTSLLFNYLLRLEKKEKTIGKVSIVPLGRKDALDQIKALDTKNDKTLLLDALDEDAEAAIDCKKRITTIMDASSNFKSVLLTCRTQFFLNDSSIPRSTGIIKVGPRRGGEEAFYEFRTVYLHPFNDEQVNKYLRKIYPLNVFRRRRALAIVDKIPQLSARPMLLTLIPDLLNNDSNIREVWELYDFMVNKWLDREKGWIEPEELLRVSIVIAVDLVMNKSIRKSERVSLDELSKIINTSKTEVEEWRLTARSLLNRDFAGNFKFAHRSIMEFLFVKDLINKNDKCLTCEWTDMICELFLSWGRCNTDEASTTRAREILGKDLRATKFFPVSTRTSGARPAKAARKYSRSSFIGGVPYQWRVSTSRFIERHLVSRAYEFSQGLVWQYSNIENIPGYDLGVFGVAEFERKWVDKIGRTWNLPTPDELISFLYTLSAHGRLDRSIDSNALYWVHGGGPGRYYVAQVTQHAQSKDAGEHLGWIKDSTHNLSGLSPFSNLDLYRRESKFVPAGSLRALAIQCYRGKADEIWVEDKSASATEDWSLSLNRSR